MSLDNVITIEENAQYLLKSNSDLRRDADISSAVIYQDSKYKRGCQPLLTSPQPVNHTFTPFDYHQEEEDVLLNPNQYKSTISIGGQSYGFDDDVCSEPKTERGLMTPSAADTLIDKPSDCMIKNTVWSTSNWTSIFLHFHSVQHDQFMYPCVLIIGIVFLMLILFLQLMIIPPSHFLFCRYLNWVLLLLFAYIMAFVISYSKASTKRWCLIRDYLYVIFWINSLCAICVGIAMKCLPFAATGVEDYLKYVNCGRNDYHCERYKVRFGLTQSEMDVFMVISHSIPFLYCVCMSVLFAHKDAFQKPCRELLITIGVGVLWCFWNTVSYMATDKWAYKGMDILYTEHNINVGYSVLIVLVITVGITCILYWICDLLHRNCRCCQNNYSKYFKPRTLAAKMAEKKQELGDMPDRDDAFTTGIAL